MTKQDIISRIIELEMEITTRILSDRNFKASTNDVYQKHREELKILREKIYVKSKNLIKE